MLIFRVVCLPQLNLFLLNVYNLKTAKGVFIKRNKILENLLEKKGYNIDSVWDQILKDQGSILGLPDYILSPEEKEIFLTFKEINQLEIVKYFFFFSDNIVTGKQIGRAHV